ncbi:hypothetical protein SLS62_005622 [Diatrype stigma]|uniref:Uncharacterized protein n=1 Tax=Diatrype stigma TaxID=117547 RepID=A0AAN9UNZ8_9PEZI
MNSSSDPTIDLHLDGFKIHGIKDPLRDALQYQIQGVYPVEGLPGSEEETLACYANQHLVNLALGAVKFQDTWIDYHDDNEFMQALVEQLIEHEDRLFARSQLPASSQYTVVTGPRVAKVLAELSAAAKKPVSIFKPPHNPLGANRDWDAIPPPMLGCQVPGSTQSYDEIATNLEKEVQMRGSIEKDVMVEGVVYRGIDCTLLNIRPLLEDVDAETRDALSVMLAEVQRTRAVPDMTVDSKVWHELCDDSCQILVYGVELDHIFSFPAFARRLAYWYERLAATTAEGVAEFMELRKKQAEEIADDGDSDTDSEVEFILEQKTEKVE